MVALPPLGTIVTLSAVTPMLTSLTTRLDCKASVALSAVVPRDTSLTVRDKSVISVGESV